MAVQHRVLCRQLVNQIQYGIDLIVLDLRQQVDPVRGDDVNRKMSDEAIPQFQYFCYSRIELMDEFDVVLDLHVVEIFKFDAELGTVATSMKVNERKNARDADHARAGPSIVASLKITPSCNDR